MERRELSIIEEALKGLQILHGDLKHIEWCMERLPQNRYAWFLQQYRRTWENTAELEPNLIMKNNAGRRAANLWLVEQVASNSIFNV